MSDVIQRAFNAGEVAEEYWFRNDLEWFSRSVRSLVNFIPLSGGALVRRPGTIKKFELPFKPSVLEKINKYIWVAIGGSSSDVYFANFSSNFVGLSTYSAPALYANSNQFEFANVSDGTPYDSSYHFVVSFAARFARSPIYVKNSSFYIWTSDYFFTSNYNLIAPTITVNVPGGGDVPVYYQVSTVTSNGAESLPSDIASDAGDALSASNPATITWNEPPYDGNPVAKYYVYRVESGVSRFVGDVRATLTGSAKTFVDYAFNRDVNLGPVTSALDSSVVNATSITLHQQRLVGSFRESYFASRVGVQNSFYYSTPINDSDSFSAKIVGAEEIKYVRSISGELMLFTDVGIYVNRGDNTGALTPTTNGVSLRWADPVGDFQPLAYKGGVLYLNKNYQLKMLARSANGGEGYSSINLSEFTNKVDNISPPGRIRLEPGIADLIWVRCNRYTDGVSSSSDSWRACLVDDSGAFAWSNYKTDGTVVAARDDVIVVERLVNGVAKYYVEEFQPLLDDRVTGCYLDCAKRFSAPFTQTISVPHLAGMTVKAVVDGFEQGPFVVDPTGNVTLTTLPTTSLLVGLPYESAVTTHNLDLVGVTTLARQPKATSCASIYFKNTSGGEVRVNGDPWQNIRLRDESDGYGPVALKSGLTEDIYLSTSPRREQTLSIRQTSPFPMTIVAIARSIKGA